MSEKASLECKGGWQQFPALSSNYALTDQYCHTLSSDVCYFFGKIDNRIPNYKHIPISTLIIQLMNSTDYYLNKQLVQYVSSCLEMRDNLLSKV